MLDPGGRDSHHGGVPQKRMLTLLKIRNLALVDELVWELGSGLIGVTGETGAGKSVIVGALKLVLGERAEKNLIRTGEETCSVEAVFELKDAAEVNAVLEDGGLDPCDGEQLIIRRVIGQTANRQFVNDSPVTLALLKRLGEHLVDLHGPHDHQSLLSVERQLAMLDAYAGAEKSVSTYRESYRAWREKAQELEEIRHAENASEQELDLLRYQLQEIDGANVKPEDEQDLEDRWRRASNASRLVEAAAAATAALNGEDGILERLTEVQRFVRELEKLDPSIRERTASLETACLELQDLESNLADYADELDINPAEAATLEERVNVIETLKRKYGPSLTDVLARRDAAAARLDTIENRGEKLETLERELVACRAALDAAGKSLGALRKKAARPLARRSTCASNPQTLPILRLRSPSCAVSSKTIWAARLTSKMAAPRRASNGNWPLTAPKRPNTACRSAIWAPMCSLSPTASASGLIAPKMPRMSWTSWCACPSISAALMRWIPCASSPARA